MTRVVALTAMVIHLWVTMVVAPWHHLTEHCSAGVQADASREQTRPVSSCRCGSHHHRTQTKTFCDGRVDGRANDSDVDPTPASPAHHHDCQICQVLALQYMTAEIPRGIVALEPVEFSPPVTAVQPMLGSLIDPDSRGPPAV